MVQERLTVKTRDETRIALSVYAHPSPQVVVICPGFCQSQDAKRFRWLTQALSEGFDVVVFDFRGHGRSGGWYTFSACESEDLHAVLAYASRRWDRVGVLAFSLGAAVAIATLAITRQAESLVTVSAPTAFEAIENHWWRPSAMWATMQALDRHCGVWPGSPFKPKPRPIEHVAQLSPIPVLFIHGELDRIVYPRHARLLYERAHEPKAILVIPGAGHAEDIARTHGPKFLTEVTSWFHQTLEP